MSRRLVRLLLGVMAWANWSPGPTCAQEPALLQRVGSASLRTSNTIEGENIVLGFTDLLTLMIDVEGDAGQEVRAPSKWTEGPWQVQTPAPGKQVSGRWSQTLILEPLAPGETSLMLSPLQVRQGEGAWQPVSWKPIAVRVTSQIARPDPKSLRDITAIEELPTPPVPESYRGLWALLAGGVLALGLGLWWWRRTTGKRRGITLEERALREWERLQALSLPDKGKHERFATLLAGLVRRYLEKKHQIRASRQTTAEFLAMVALHPRLAAQRAELEDFLRRSDLLKFAPVEASNAECRLLSEQVRQMIVAQQRENGSVGT